MAESSEAPKKAHRRERFFCIDVESSGPVPGIYNMVSLGCVAVDEPRPLEYRPGQQLYLELMPVFPGIEKEAMDVNGLDAAKLLREGLPPVVAMERLRAFALERTPADHRAVFVGHNAPFDWMMVCYYFHYAGVANPFGYSAIDTKALAMGLFGLAWGDTSKEVLPPLLGIGAEDTAQKHRADYDAFYQAEMFCGLMRKHREVAAREHTAR